MYNIMNEITFIFVLQLQYTRQLPDELLENSDWSVLETEVTRSFKRVPEYTTLLGKL